LRSLRTCAVASASRKPTTSPCAAASRAASSLPRPAISRSGPIARGSFDAPRPAAAPAKYGLFSLPSAYRSSWAITCSRCGLGQRTGPHQAPETLEARVSHERDTRRLEATVDLGIARPARTEDPCSGCSTIQFRSTKARAGPRRKMPSRQASVSHANRTAGRHNSCKSGRRLASAERHVGVRRLDPANPRVGEALLHLAHGLRHFLPATAARATRCPAWPRHRTDGRLQHSGAGHLLAGLRSRMPATPAHSCRPACPHHRDMGLVCTRSAVVS